MRFSMIALAALLAFGGCADKSAFGMFAMDETHERAVEQMRSGSIIQSFETKALISAVYLNPVYPEEYKDGDYFIAALYFEKRNLDTKKWDIKDHGYTLTLNGIEPSSMEEIKEKDPRRALIPIQNNWNRYYLVRFENVKGSALALKLENNQTGSVVLSYPKEN
ncbi:MAG: hypothetical protein JXK04_09485 [Campylobacterales bacterium]|nr:hypothetical protein [Campylobacterales bacterium]